MTWHPLFWPAALARKDTRIKQTLESEALTHEQPADKIIWKAAKPYRSPTAANRGWK